MSRFYIDVFEELRAEWCPICDGSGLVFSNSGYTTISCYRCNGSGILYWYVHKYLPER